MKETTNAEKYKEIVEKEINRLIRWGNYPAEIEISEDIEKFMKFLYSSGMEKGMQIALDVIKEGSKDAV